MRCRDRFLIMGLIATLLASPAAAQRIDLGRAAVWVSSDNAPAPDLSRWIPSRFPQPAARVRPLAPLASLVIPGAGQWMLGQDRVLTYLAIEALGWWMYAKDVQERRAQEASYKELARRVARATFSTTLPDADWLYYEWMRDDIESGRYSLAVSGPTVPETDTTTYNGKRWSLALGTHPTYEGALEQYEREAIRPEYRWSWRNAQLQYDIYKRTTDKRNDAAHAAVQDLLVIGANHFLSMIDAFAAIRLRVQTTQSRATAVGATVRW
jgi:hypothetical protein